MSSCLDPFRIRASTDGAEEPRGTYVSELTFRDLRHGAGSRLLEAGWLLHDVSAHLDMCPTITCHGPISRWPKARRCYGAYKPSPTGHVMAFPEVGGLHHRYERRAA